MILVAGLKKKKKSRLSKISEFFGIFAIFFHFGFYWKSVFYAKCPFGRIGGLEFFLIKRMDAEFQMFDIFYAEKRPFFRFWDPLTFQAEGPKKLDIIEF